jgi:5'-nucleotidase
MDLIMDIDGVLADLSTEWHRLYQRDYHDNWDVENAKWDVHLYVKPECGMKIYDYLKDPCLYDNVKPIEGAIDAVNFLKNYFRIIYATTSPIETFGVKYYWLKRYDLISRLEDYIEIKDKSLLYADYLVDDKYENARDFVSGIGVLFTQSWNKKFDYPYRLNGWRNKDEIKKRFGL